MIVSIVVLITIFVVAVVVAGTVLFDVHISDRTYT